MSGELRWFSTRNNRFLAPHQRCRASFAMFLQVHCHSGRSSGATAPNDSANQQEIGKREQGQTTARCSSPTRNSMSCDGGNDSSARGKGGRLWLARSPWPFPAFPWHGPVDSSLTPCARCASSRYASPPLCPPSPGAWQQLNTRCRRAPPTHRRAVAYRPGDVRYVAGRGHKRMSEQVLASTATCVFIPKCQVLCSFD